MIAGRIDDRNIMTLTFREAKRSAAPTGIDLTNRRGGRYYADTMWFLTAYLTSSAFVLAPSTCMIRYL